MSSCPACAANAPDDARFCPSCGGEISSSSPSATQAASPSIESAARRRSTLSTPVGRLASSDPAEDGGFTPGVVLAERYRVIGLLGRGGMGEVYRADDLKLGQPVALKFLSKAGRVATDAKSLERFYAEVRIARQVSHPNVCRVYDVGEIGERRFLSMELVDGEDLASLLRRIGRLPPDKALEISREICAGLAAAHDKGVLHRDLKPANVMIDGRGRARITDFGLAVAATDARAGDISGTPSYMPPEVLAGRGWSVRSDIYALGLVISELHTGRKVFDADTLPELARMHAEDPPASPSRSSPGLDPAVERVILRCLEKEPEKRPRSVAQVAAALPGGDPLAAALAAGETPSPEMVAAAGEEGALPAAKAWALLAAPVAMTAIFLLLGPRATDLGLAPLPRSTDSLVDRAREIAGRLGHAATPADSAAWWTRNEAYFVDSAAKVPGPRRYRELATVEPHPWWLWYRQSPRPMSALNGAPYVKKDDPPLAVSGMARLALDARGRLMRFTVVPPQVVESAGPSPEPDWSASFADAGLDPRAFTPAEPTWTPPVAFDRRAEWTGRYASQPDVPIRVVAASFRGTPVFFEVLGPWDHAAKTSSPAASSGALTRLTVVIFAVVVITLASVVARRNLRLGRCDLRGAFRVSAFVLAVSVLDWLFRAHHSADPVVEWVMLTARLGAALFNAGFAWLAYIAIEPFVRRRWPHLLISWTRLVSGRWRDPLVGRDALLGLAAGGATPVLFLTCAALPWWIDARGVTPQAPSHHFLDGNAAFAGELTYSIGFAVIQALAIMTLLVLTRVLLRSNWAAFGVTAIAMTFLTMSFENVALEIPFAFLAGVITVVVATRMGLVALLFQFLVADVLTDFPLTLDTSSWYAGRFAFVLLFLAAVCLWAFRSALGGNPAFGTLRIREV